jgi:hypothetical protein
MKTAEWISRWIRERVEEAGAEGVVVGMSGGVDSSVVAVLAKRGLGNKVLGLIMPCHSDPTSAKHAQLVATKFGIETEYVDLTPVFDRLVEALPPGDRVAVGNLKPRLRMATLYYFANSRNYLVVGTGNKSEIQVGYFCYDEHTRAMTTEGLKSYKDLKPGDVVFSLDLDTGHVIESLVADVHVFDYEGDMLAYGGGPGSKIDLMVTPNHRMLREWYGRPQFCRADEWPRRPTLTPTPKPWAGKRGLPSMFEFDHDGVGVNARRFVPMPIGDFLYILGLYIGDGHAQTSSIIHPLRAAIVPTVIPKQADLWS